MTKKNPETRSSNRRNFLKGAAIVGAVAATGAASALTARAEETFKTAAQDPATGQTVVTPGSPLIVKAPMKLGDIVLDGGQIVIRGGGEIRIDRLTKR